MGFESDEFGIEHEGFLVGIIQEGRYDFREVGARHGDVDTVPLKYVCVGCQCGWRSPRMLAPTGTEWSPNTVWLAHGQPEENEEAYRATARNMWSVHIDEMKRIGGRVVMTLNRQAFEEAIDRRVRRELAEERRRQGITNLAQYAEAKRRPAKP